MKSISIPTNVKYISSIILISLFMVLSISAQALSTNDTEPYLKVEIWMTSIEEFNNSETTLEMEEWMTNINSFCPQDNESQLIVEQWMTDLNLFVNTDELQLMIEGWMTSLTEFNKEKCNTLLIAEEAEQALQIENWMTSLNNYTNMPANTIETIKSINFDNQVPVLIALQY